MWNYEAIKKIENKDLKLKAETLVLGTMTSISLTNMAKKESESKTSKLLTPYFLSWILIFNLNKQKLA